MRYVEWNSVTPYKITCLSCLGEKARDLNLTEFYMTSRKKNNQDICGSRLWCTKILKRSHLWCTLWMFSLTLCTHSERSSKFPSVSNSWCMSESQQYVSTYAACFIVKLLGGKQLICGPGRETQRNEHAEI